MIKIEMLRTFAEVARTGSLSAAAQVLGRTPSAVSMTLKQLEADLGAALFESERKTRLTALGRHTLALASRELDHFDRTRAALADFAAGRVGEVRVAAVPSVAATVLPELARGFVTGRPGVRLDIRDLDSASILAALREGRVDLGIASDTVADPELARRTLGHDVFGAVMRAEDPRAAQVEISWADLARPDFISNPLCERIAPAEVQADLKAAALRVHNTTTLLAMVRAGVGVTVLPDLVTRHAGAGVSFVPLAAPTPRRALDLLSRAGETPNAATAAFVEAVGGEAGRLLSPGPLKHAGR